MSDKGILYLSLGVSVATLVITYKMAVALRQAQLKIDSVAGAGTALGDLGKAFGW